MHCSTSGPDELFPRSVAARVVLDNAHIVSLVMYEAQLVAMTHYALKAASRALERILKAHWQGAPSPFLCNATSFGLPVVAHTMSSFGRGPHSFVLSGVLSIVIARIAAFKQSDAAALDPRRSWHS